MRHSLSYRDFDWPLLGLMLTLCTISIFEIYHKILLEAKIVKNFKD